MLIMPHFGKTAEPRTRVAEGSRLGHQTGVWTRSQWPVPSRKRITRPGGTEVRAVPPGVGAEALISPPRSAERPSAGECGGPGGRGDLLCPPPGPFPFLFYVFRVSWCKPFGSTLLARPRCAVNCD